MATKVVITKAELEAHGACPAYFDSPEWDPENEELVYSDWEATVARLSDTTQDLGYLWWLVARRLVPMTPKEFRALKKAKRTEAQGGGES